ncbi:MAG TPA: HAMP domain-containing sensor histidine kinase [Candidatus Kapabacteria bacterium]|nr:HAMP domain-containing sensor histidine kinase [Candidatus Kapabacteria bacterium]
MLYEFLTRERDTILTAAKQKASEARWARISTDAEGDGWGVFYDDLTGLLKTEERGAADGAKSAEPAIPERKGKEYLRLGYAISEVVQSFSIIYQAITESAVKLAYEITPDDFTKLNASFDSAVAEVITEFGKVQTEAQDAQTDAQDQREAERLGSLAHELRNSLQSATITLEMIEGGIIDVKSKTGGVLHSSLESMTELIDRALAEVRLQIEPAVRLRKIRLFDVLSEVGVTAGYQARMRKLTLRMQAGSGLEVLVDRHLLISALSNLIQNALKFTKPNGTIQVRARQDKDRVLIEVEDECGGLPGKIEDLFEPGVQKAEDKTGMGLGLTISRQAVERNKGELRVQNLPGKGCIFIIDLPKPAAK